VSKFYKILTRILLIVCIGFGAVEDCFAQPYINEFSNGPSGAQEFIEIVVTGTPGSTYDMRGWVVDDNSGFFGCGTGQGIASGHIRFDSSAQWICTKVGSIIVLYNFSDPHPDFSSLADDPTDANNDYVYIIPVQGAQSGIVSSGSFPSTVACNSFGTFLTTGGNWGNNLGLANGGDGVTLVDPATLATTPALFHGVAYGSISSPPSIYTSGSGAQMGYRFYNTTNNDPTLNVNWTLDGTANDNPGIGNNASNTQWINSLRGGPLFTSILQGNCSSTTVNFSSNISGSQFIIEYGELNAIDTNTLGQFSYTYSDTGSYQVVFRVINSNGCLLTDTLNLILQNAPTPTITGVTICAGQQTTLSPSGGSGNYAFYDANIGGNLLFTGASYNVSPTLTTIYYVSDAPTVSCPNPPRAGVQVTVLTLPDASFTISGLPASNQVCAPFSGNLLPTLAGGVFSGPGVTGSTVAYSNPGVYQLTYSISGTCFASSTVTVTVLQAPDADFILDSIICPAAFTLIPSTGVYIGTGVSGYVFTPPGLGNYTITHIETLGGCSDTSVKSTTVVSGLGNAAFTGLNPTYCQGDPPSTLLPNNGLYSGLGMQGNIFTPDFPGTYVIVHTVQQGGCSDTALKFVTVYPKPVITFQNASEICLDQIPYTLSGTPAGGTFSGVGVSNGLLSGTLGSNKVYYLYTNSNGCTSTDSQLITISPVYNAEFSIPDTFCVGEPFSLNPAQPGGSILSPQVNNPSAIVFDVPGVIQITYAIGSGICADTVTKAITIVECPDPNLDIPNVFTPDGNLINDTWVLSAAVVPESYEMVVFNRWGQEVYKSNTWGIWWGQTATKPSKGVYYYLLNIKFPREEKKSIKNVVYVH